MSTIGKPDLNYIVIGSPKCGTTSFCTLLGQHPDVFITTPKEPRFFSEAIFLKERDWSWYASLFESVNGEQAVGEGTVNYTCSHYRQLADPQVIFEAYPDVKLIYMVRNPIERTESHWLHSAIMGWPSDVPDFDNAVRNYGMFLNTSRYWSHINRYRAFFADAQIHVIFFEDFVRDPKHIMRQAFEFIRVDPNFEVIEPNKPRNASKQPYIDSGLMRFVRQHRVLQNLKKSCPVRFKTILTPIFKNKNLGHPQWNPVTLKWAINEIKYDALAFLNFCNKPEDYWILDKN
ncbi:MAG: sulfotransferase [Anaerolineales bacterium]|nr:sulfotransferase [Anaerolineales bacterium]